VPSPPSPRYIPAAPSRTAAAKGVFMQGSFPHTNALIVFTKCDISMNGQRASASFVLALSRAIPGGFFHSKLMQKSYLFCFS
jgi:hypothetical protein